jgi:flagellin
MPQIINTNSLSLLAQNNLNTSQIALNTSIQRLSSGLRINSAKDDAAGQAIANRFTANIRGLAQAQRNANDGISIAQTTEGALKEVNNNLQRVRELSVQAANGTNSASDLKSIQDEIQERMDEIDRVSAQTQFNGVKVLTKDAKMTIQVGANDGEAIDINLKQIDSTTLNMSTFNVTGPVGATAAAVAADFQAEYGSTTAVGGSTVAEATAGDLAGRLGISTSSVTFTTADALVDANGNWFAQVDIQATNQTESDVLAAYGFDIAVGGTASFYVGLDPQAADTTTSSTNAAFTIDTSTLTLSDLRRSASPTQLATVDAAIAQVDTLRSALGAAQNRFDSTIANLGTTIINLSTSRSRIEDSDYAVEVSNMTRAQILQQAGTSVLAQANQATQSVLSLLR